MAANTVSRNRLHTEGLAAWFHCDIEALRAESTQVDEYFRRRRLAGVRVRR
jgi:hypothetical protein